MKFQRLENKFTQDLKLDDANVITGCCSSLGFTTPLSLGGKAQSFSIHAGGTEGGNIIKLWSGNLSKEHHS